MFHSLNKIQILNPDNRNILKMNPSTTSKRIVQTYTWYIFLLPLIFGQSFSGVFLFKKKAFEKNIGKKLLVILAICNDLFFLIILIHIQYQLNSEYYIDHIFQESLNNKSVVHFLLRTFFGIVSMEFIIIKITIFYYSRRISEIIDIICK